MRVPLLAGLLLLQAVIHVQTKLVVVPVTVTDAHGHSVSGLSQDSFHLFDDGRPQSIAVFHRGDVPVTLGLIIDRSQSMRPKTMALQGVVAALLDASRPDDELFAVAFNDRVSDALSTGQAFTSDKAALGAALAAIRAEGRTALYDGVAEGLRHLHLGHTGKHALIVVSDGGDNASRQTYAQILALARQSDTVIYAIGLLGRSTAEEEEDGDLLTRLCRDTGGIALFPKTPDENVPHAMQIARDLREQYTLGFVPGDQGNLQAFRRIEVRVTAPGQGRLQVRTRAGYVPGDDKDARIDRDER